MSVFLFDYPGSFAYRVQRSANGVVRCRYYSCNIKLKKGGFRRAGPSELERIRCWAEKYDAKLAEWQAREQRKGLGEAKPSRRNNTGVKGIRYGVDVEHKRGRRYEWPSFFVCCAREDGRQFNKPFNVGTLGYEVAWRQAVECLGKVKGFSSEEVERLKERMPNPVTRLMLSLMGGGDLWARRAAGMPHVDPFSGHVEA